MAAYLFSDDVRDIMRAANMAAQQYNHEWIGTEHILLGMIKAGPNLGVLALLDAGVNVFAVQASVDRNMPTWPEMVTMGRLPQTPWSQKVVQRAGAESAAANEKLTDTGHLLVALVQITEGIAYEVLTSHGITEAGVRAAVSRVKMRLTDTEQVLPGPRTDDALRRLKINLGNPIMPDADAIDYAAAIVRQARQAAKRP